MLHSKAFLLASCGITALSVWGTTIQSAAAVSFDDVTAGTLTFESNGNVVGSGTFTYEPTDFQGTFTPPPPVPGFTPLPTLTITADQHLRLVDSINIALFGTPFSNTAPGYAGGPGTLSVVDYFWGVPGSVFPDPNVGIQEVVQGGPPRPSIALEDRWAFGSTRGTYLIMSNDGSWNATTPGEYHIGGTWTATAAGVPEPFTVLGSITAAITGYTLKRRLKQSA